MQGKSAFEDHFGFYHSVTDDQLQQNQLSPLFSLNHFIEKYALSGCTYSNKMYMWLCTDG